jgi:hypothetical protein
MTATETTLYKACFERPVIVKGTIYGGRFPFKAAYITTGEGPAFRHVVEGSVWDTLDIRLYDRQFDDSKSLPLRLTIIVPDGWDTRLILALLVHYVRDNNALQFLPIGCFMGVFEWFMQDATTFANFLHSQDDVYKSIQTTEGTALT